MSNFDSKFAWPGTNRKFAITNSTCYLNDLKKSEEGKGDLKTMMRQMSEKW